MPTRPSPVTITEPSFSDILNGSSDWDSLLIINRAAGSTTTVQALAGNDTVEGGDSNDSIDGGTGNDSINGGAGNDTLLGGAGNDTLRGAEGNDSLDGGNGNDSLDGGADNDTLLGQAGNDSLDGGDGNDSLNGGAGNDSLNGDAGNDTLRGGAGNDTISGGGGSNRFEVDAGSDRILDLQGDDVIVISAGASAAATVTGNFTATAATSNAGTAILTVANGVNIDLSAATGTNGFTVTASGNSAGSRLVGSARADSLVGGLGNDTLEGGRANDTLVGGAGDDSLSGGSDNDRLNGDDGDDTLEGGAGSDTLNGGVGNDVFVVRNVADFTSGDRINGNTGGTNPLGGVLGGLLVGGLLGGPLGGLLGGLVGGLVGGSGSNSDANGFDTLYLGGAGTYTLGLGQVNSIERFKLGNPEGTDNEASNLIATALPFDGGAIFEGNEAANVILSTIDSDTVMGNGGSDVLLALAGDDLVEGGEGVDIVFGDAITAGELATLVSLIGGQLNGLNLGGVDLGALLSGAGGLLDGVLGAVIGSGNDTLVGGNGIDLLLGGAGNDSLSGGTDIDLLLGGAGNDTMDGGTGSADLGLGLALPLELDLAAYLLATGGVTVDLDAGLASNDGDGGVDTLSNIEGVIGSNFNDQLKASNSDLSLLAGLDGNDELTAADKEPGIAAVTLNPIGVSLNPKVNLLFGNDGNDTVRGGQGAINILSGDGISISQILEALGKLNIEVFGIPIAIGGLLSDVIESVGNTIPPELDALLNTGSGEDLIYGADVDEFADVNITSLQATIFGADFLFGGAGNDTVFGLAGDDFIYGGNGNDSLDGGNGSDDIVGEAGDDRIEGGTDNDTLNGGDGNDTLIGGEGNDVLIGGADTNRFVVDAGTDEVRDLKGSDELVVSADATANASVTADFIATAGTINDGTANLAVTNGVGADLAGATGSSGFRISAAGTSAGSRLTGSVLIDTLIGGDGGDSLNGGAGADSLNGGAGGDTIHGGAGADRLAGGASTTDAQDVFLFSFGDSDLFDGAADADLSLTDTLIDWTNGSEVGGYSPVDRIALADGTALSLMADGTGGLTLDAGQVIGGVTGVTANDRLLDFITKASADTTAGASAIYAEVDDTSVQASYLFISDGIAGLGADDLLIELEGLNVNAGFALESGAIVRIFGTEFPSEGPDSIVGTSGDDLIDGLGGNDTLLGLAGNDTLRGNTGEDLLLGGPGDDNLDGGADTDTVSYQGVSSAVTINLATGSATGEGTDTLANIENAIGGDGSDSITGDSNRNRLEGGDGADTIRGGDGADLLIGGLGADIFEYGASTEGGNQYNVNPNTSGFFGNNSAFTLATTLLSAFTGPNLRNIDLITGFAKGEDKIDLRGVKSGLSFQGSFFTDYQLPLGNIDTRLADNKVGFVPNATNNFTFVAVNLSGTSNDFLIALEGNFTGANALTADDFILS